MLEARQLVAGNTSTSEQTRCVLLGNSFVGGNRGSEDSDIRFDDGPVHGIGDDPGLVSGSEHGWDVGDSDDGGDTSARRY